MAQSPSDRDRLADERDRLADARDRHADLRDREADERDRRADMRDRNIDEQDRHAQDGDETTGEEPTEAPYGSFGDDRFGVDLGPRHRSTKVTEPDVAAPSPPVSHRGKSLTERLAEAADGRDGPGSPMEDDPQGE
jgi:hypothetical protein